MKKIFLTTFAISSPLMANELVFQTEEAPTPYINIRADLNAEGTGFVPDASTFEVDKTGRSIVYNKGARWPDTANIPVCWINPGDAGEIVGDLQNHLTAEYRKANLFFKYEGTCNSDSWKTAKIRVWFKRTHIWTNESSIGGGGGLSFIGLANAILGGSEGQGTMNIQIAKDIIGYAKNRWAEWTKNITRATAVHEFGHAMGLAHEQSRNDAPVCNDQRGDLKNDGTYVFVGAYDQYSIMNYCRNGANVSSLSDGDLAGLRYLYPNAGVVNPPAPSSGEPKGSHRLVSKFNGKCVDINSSSKDNSVQLQQYDCNGTQAQSFWIQNSGDGYVYLVNTNSGKCLDVRSSSKDNGAVVQQYDCNRTDAQRITFDAPNSKGEARIKFKASGKCLDVKDWSKENKGKLQQWDCGSGDNQYWGLPQKG